jgi:hypothetical protein
VSEDEAPRSEPGHGDEEARAASPDHHDTATHMDAHTAISDDDHGHGEEPLGPIDWGAWGVAVIAGATGLVVAALFWVAIS